MDDSDVMDLVMVEDDEDFLSMAETYLELVLPDNVSKNTFTDPLEAVDHLEDNGANVVVSDYDMPHLNGVEFYREVEDIDPDLPFILHTGKGSEEIAVEAWHAGVDEYVRKGSGDNMRDTYEELAGYIVENGTRCMEIKELKKLRPLGNAILDSEIPLFVVDEDIEITFANENLLDNLGYEFHELLGEKPSKINDIPETDYDDIGQVIDEEKAWSGQDITFYGAQGQEYNVGNHLVARVSKSDEEEFRVGIAYDFEQIE